MNWKRLLILVFIGLLIAIAMSRLSVTQPLPSLPEAPTTTESEVSGEPDHPETFVPRTTPRPKDLSGDDLDPDAPAIQPLPLPNMPL